MSYIFTSKKVKTRKAHHCWGCCREIPKGSTVLYQSGINEGFYSVHWCAICEILQEKTDAQDGIYYGDLADLAKEYEAGELPYNCTICKEEMNLFRSINGPLICHKCIDKRKK